MTPEIRNLWFAARWGIAALLVGASLWLFVAAARPED
jgi:hypothetical protein